MTPAGPTHTLVIRLDPRYRTAGLLKVLSVLHSRRVTVHHMHYGRAPDQTAVALVECSLGRAGVDTVSRSIANAVPVLAVTASTSLGSPRGADAAAPEPPPDVR